MNVNVSSEIRTKTAASLSRNISIAEMHNFLNGMFVDRLELENELVKETKQQWIDNCLNLDNEYYMHQNCFLMHKESKEFERMAKNKNWQDLFIEDEKGGNNAW